MSSWLRGGRYRPAYARIEQAMKAADLLLAGGGFGMVALDFAGLPTEAVRRVPLTTWFRFRRTVETTSTVLLLVSPQPVTQSCAALSLKLQPATNTLHCHHEGAPAPEGSAFPSHATLLTGFRLHAEVIRSPALRKPARSAQAQIETQAQWAI